MQYSLDYLWELVNGRERQPDAEKKAMIDTAEMKRTAFLRLVDDEQLTAFYEYFETLIAISEYDKRAAFSEGVKLATRFLLEATDNKISLDK